MAMLPWWIHYPYVNNEIQNLDWLLQISNENTDKIENFIGVNTIKYADPILWDITSQYEANTIVVDPQTGDAYISTKAVPYGVALSNDSYWTRIYNYASEIHTFREQIAADEQLSTTATAPRSVDDLVFLNGLLYIVTAPMIAGDSYVEGSNCAKTTINGQLLRLHTEISSISGSVDDEAEARADADTALGQRIDDEAEARADADTALGQRIDDEAEARADADTALGQRIDDEAEARADADTALGQRIDDEAQAREDADDALQASINNIKTVYNIIYDVTKYGAVGDNVNDDTNAINNTIALAASNGGGIVFIPKGNYKTTGPIIGGDKVSIIGEGAANTYIRANHYSTTANLANATGLTAALNLVNVDIRNCIFKDFTILSDAEISLTNVCVGILGGSSLANYNSAIARFENIRISNMTIGIDGRGDTTGVGIFDSIFDNVFVAGSKWCGIVNAGSQNLYSHCRITTNVSGVMLWHLNDESFDGGLFENCIFIQNGYDITIRPAGGNRPTVFLNTWFEQSLNGIINIPYSNTRSMMLTFDGCMLQSDTTQYDMFIASNLGSGELVIKNCTLYQISSTTNNNVTLPTSDTSLLAKVVDCVKIAYNGVVTIFST